MKQIASILKGHAFNNKGEYMIVYIDGDLENVAAFIARCSPYGKVVITDTSDMLVLNSIGNYIDRIDDKYMDYRLDLLEYLIPMQTCEVEIPDVRIEFNPEDFDNKISKYDFVKSVEKQVNYKLEGPLY